MYIGPWQEYSLSKQRKTNPTMDFRKGIEAAVANSLDPTAAQAAIEAMESYFNQQQGTTLQLPQIHQNETLRRPRNLYHPSAFKEDSTKLPLLDTYMATAPSSSSRFRMVSSARDKIPSATASPISVRSTKSEPISATKLPSLFPKVNGSNNTTMQLTASNLASEKRRQSRTNRTLETTTIGIASPDMMTESIKETQITQPLLKNTKNESGTYSLTNDYDTTTALGLLRMDRNERAKAEISKLTGWKNNKSKAATACEDTLKISKPPKPKDNNGHDPHKLEQIKQMKELYLANQLASTHQKLPAMMAETMASPKAAGAVSKVSVKIVNEGIAVEHVSLSPVGSPRVNDMDVTESDLLHISKYFKSTNSNNTNSNMSTTNDNKALMSKKAASSSSSSSYRAEEEAAMRQAEDQYHYGNDSRWGHVDDEVQSEEQDDDANYYLDKQSSSQKSIKSTTKPALFADTPYVDDLYAGIGADSLLKWSAQLEFDDF